MSNNENECDIPMKYPSQKLIKQIFNLIQDEYPQNIEKMGLFVYLYINIFVRYSIDQKECIRVFKEYLKLHRSAFRA